MRLAPTAFRKPISRVFSPTETRQIFIIPMPLTSNEKPAMPPKAIFIIFSMRSNCLTVCLGIQSYTKLWVPRCLLLITFRADFTTSEASTSF